MYKPLLYILCLCFCFACKQSTKSDTLSQSDKDRVEVITHLEKEFLGRVGIMQLKKPYLISNRIFNVYNNLIPTYVELLDLKKVFKNHKSSTKFGLERQIAVLDSVKTFVAYQFDENEQTIYKLVNYTSDYVYIDDMEVSYFDLTTKMNTIDTYLFQQKLFVHNKETDKAVTFHFNSNGTFTKVEEPTQFNFKALKEYKHVDEFLANYNRRVVKAKNGLIIRDSLGAKIGKYNFLESVSVLEYGKESITITDNGKKIKGVKAKVIINPKTLKKDQNYFVPKSNIGYVFTGFLYKDETEEQNYVYDYFGLKLSQHNEYITPFSLKELFDIKTVNIKNYKNRVIKTPNVKDVTKLYKTNKTISLKAENGNVVKYKDTTYSNREFEPTKLFYVSEDQDFRDAYIVNYQMLFDYRHFYFVDKQTGETTNTYFGGYPYASPNKDIIISVDYDAECPSQRTLFIDKMANNKLIKVLQVHFDTEKQKELNFVKTTDKNELYWLSNTEFIVKFWGATECYDDTTNYFYFKFKLKQSLLDILELY